jgi:Zinc finger C-x8-C-x5-C-x3-H type (and similar)
MNTPPLLSPTCAAALKSKLCPYFARLGTCRKGNHCWYSHDIASFAGLSYAEAAPSCESWRKTGECSKIATCWFAHDTHVRGARMRSLPPYAPPQHSSSSSGSSSLNCLARSVDEPPSLGEHSSREMITFLEQHISRPEVCACLVYRCIAEVCSAVQAAAHVALHVQREALYCHHCSRSSSQAASSMLYIGCLI